MAPAIAFVSPTADARDRLGSTVLTHTTIETSDEVCARMPLRFVPPHRMTPSTSVNTFEEFVENHGGSFPELTVRTGVAEMLSFYVSVLPTGCTGENGDTLLFQWGTYDWGDGTQFVINITCQFIESAAEDDDAISQLQLTFKFPPDKDTAVLGDGNR